MSIEIKKNKETEATSQIIHCPRCSIKMPKVRQSKSIQQMMSGGWNCPKCECEMDKFGNEVR